MWLYRICPESLLENYSGRGASYQDGGRWNRAGLPVLYFACSASVAMLEMANYLRSPGLVPKSYRLGIFETGAIGYEQWGIEDLPARWNDYPYPAATQALGSRWLQATTSALLLVPSAAIPAGLENIALVNPVHPGARQLKLVSVENGIFNKRAFSSEN